jgi:hypothetical protein
MQVMSLRAERNGRMKTSMVFIALAAVLIPAAANAARQPRSVLYSYAGQLIAAPGTNTVELSVANGNRRALRSLLGQSDQQTFTFDSRFLKWNAASDGRPALGARSR